MGEVYFAWAYGVARTRKPVVVKVLRQEMLSEPGAPEMFVEEGRLSLHLSHSNILQVFDFGKGGDHYFMAMEYVDGFHLGELRKKNGGRLPPAIAAFVTMEVCLALDYAHRLKDENGTPFDIVHRDVTPSNVLVSREGEVKLADFGIARAMGRSQHTQAGQIRGKVRYMSPEAARAEPLDGRTDLFSLGAVLFEALTGHRAFEAKGREAILMQIVSGPAPAPSSVAPDVPPALDAVVVRAMAPRRDDRFPDAFAMHRALEEACREAGLYPSRGTFLEFLRALESDELDARPSGLGASFRGEGIVPARPGANAETVTPSRMRLTPRTPETVASPEEEPGSGRGRRPETGDAPAGAVWPSAAEVPSGPTLSVQMSAGGSMPRAPASAPEGASASASGAKGKDPVPVLFTLTAADPEAAQGADLFPTFEVTHFDVEPPGRDANSRGSETRAARSTSSTRSREERSAGRRTASNEVTVIPSEGEGNEDEAAQSRGGDETEIRVPPRERGPAPEHETVPGIVPPEAPATPVEGLRGPSGARPESRRAEPSGRGTGLSREGTEPVEQIDERWRVRREPVRAPERRPSAEPGFPALAEPRRWPRSAGPALLGIGAILVLALLVWFARGDGGAGGTVAVATPKATPFPVRTRTAPPTRTPPPTPGPTAAALATTPRVTPTPFPTRTPRPAPTRVAVAPTTPPTPVPVGTLDINSDPWSEVRIGSRLLGNTPLLGTRLPVGRHVLSFRNPRSGVVKNVEIDVRSGQNGPVLVQLQ